MALLIINQLYIDALVAFVDRKPRYFCSTCDGLPNLFSDFQPPLDFFILYFRVPITITN